MAAARLIEISGQRRMPFDNILGVLREAAEELAQEAEQQRSRAEAAEAELRELRAQMEN